MAIIFDGRDFAAKKEEKLKKQIKKLSKTPTLVSILVGDDPTSKLYVNLKKKAAKRVGAKIKVKRFASSPQAIKLIKEIKRLNKDNSVNGIMIQLPLPKSLAPSTQNLINSIAPQKDVDGLRSDSPYLHPSSKAVIEIIDYAQSLIPSPYNLEPTVCIVGSSGMVGKPLMKELKKMKYKAIGCNSETKNLKKQTLKADILVSTTGVPNLIKEDMVKKGAIVIDVGAPSGDVNFEKVKNKASFITPVPGGVGPVTISCLLENLLKPSVQMYNLVYKTHTH